MKDDPFEFFRDFDFNYSYQEMINYLIPKVLYNHITVLALKEFTLNKLSVITNSSIEKLEEEFKEYFTSLEREISADFIGKFGDISDDKEEQ